MKASYSGKSRTMLQKILLPMALAMVLQAALSFGTIFFGGTIGELKGNAFDILNERVINRKNDLENELLQRYSSIEESVLHVNHAVQKTLENAGKDYQDILVNSPLATQILDQLTEEVIYLLRKNCVTGAFVILNGQDTASSVQETAREYSGICLRNVDPHYVTKDNADLLIEYAPSQLCKKLGIAMDTYWEPQFHFSKEEQNSDFYDKPYQAALAYPELDWKQLGYWSESFVHRKGASPLISYSVPLISEEGNVYGVMGIELSLDYLRQMLPYREINPAYRGVYVLGIEKQGDQHFETVVSSGAMYKQLFGTSKEIPLLKNLVQQQGYQVDPKATNGERSYACVQYLDLYSNNTPFAEERWAVIGLARKRDLLDTVTRVQIQVWIALAISLSLGMTIVYFVGLWTARPITSLVHQLKKSNPKQPVKLNKIHIAEIDELSTAIEQMSSQVADSASKLSQIIEIANVKIGAFEYQEESGLYYTGSLLKMLGMEENESGEINLEEFRAQFEWLEQNIEEKSPDQSQRIYHITLDGEASWLRLKLTQNQQKLLGVVSDITQEMIEKRKIEYERDYDILTSLLNRRAFHSILKKKFEKPDSLGTAAMIMLDLDNLKYINDTYGHDSGDLYIQAAAQALKRAAGGDGLVARISGDEFLLFLEGYSDQTALRQRILAVKKELRDSFIHVPDGQSFRVRASAGVAWYPSDTANYEQLIRYADFAMYRVKNTTKGEFNEFDPITYHRDSYLLHSREELNKLIDEKLILYHFQPIVSVKDGSVFAYEALMRSQLKTLKSPLEVLALARSQSKLYQIERLTWFLSMEAYEQNLDTIGDCKIFINSIPNQELSLEDMHWFEQRFGAYLSKLVLELTEEEKLDEDSTRHKQQCIRSWNSQLALDDFGTGYNGEATLLQLTPDYVKLDMSLISNINTDASRQNLVKNLISYAKMNRIQVIAEGIETKEEMETVIRLGVDLMQGYYLGFPSLKPLKVKEEVRSTIVRFYQQYRCS